MSMDTGKFGLPSFVAFSPSFAEVLKMKKDSVIMQLSTYNEEMYYAERDSDVSYAENFRGGGMAKAISLW